MAWCLGAVQEDSQRRQGSLYIVQWIGKGTRAADVVNSYQHTSDNYDKIIQAFKKEQIVIQIANEKGKTSLTIGIIGGCY
ncbi:hypothetical protein FQR65_LT11733 [Abscondita terminalis]|nr:hypothetical protein FQR65_LT11733 [Abscondita terminalis]